VTLLHPGDRFPTFTVALPGGETLSLPDALAGGFGVVLFYRGAWCPYCNAQLSAFQRASDSLAEVGAKVVALTVDDEATTAELVAKHGLTLPVGHSADASHFGGDGSVRRPRAWVPPIHRVRAQPRRPGGGQRLLVWGDRPPGARRRGRPHRLPARSRQRYRLRGRRHE
jgi:thiol-disulfide isomerase/thioredoxin